MRLPSLLLVAVAALAVAPRPAAAWDRGRAVTFAELPPGSSIPEGLEVDARGNAYVTGFGSSGPGQLTVFDAHGRIVRQVTVAGASPALLGLAFQPGTGALLVIDFGAAQVLAVDPRTGAASTFLWPGPAPHPGGYGLNDITFDAAGNVYVSDSFQGVVWRTGPTGGQATAWVDDPLMRPTGVPPFGANGLRFNRAETAMFIANTANDTIIKVPVVGGSPATGHAGTPEVFTNSVNGADGLIVDDDDNLWVAANQADEIVVIDPTGKAIAKLGDFDGIAPDGTARGLLFPASLRFSRGELLVTNLALDLRNVNATFVAVDSAWCAQVTRQTVAAIRLRGRQAD
jgi:sugar lactone lactonase YvrE